MAAVYILDVPEFRNIIALSKGREDLRVTDVGYGYFRIEADGELRFNRKELQFNPAIWYSVFSGGVMGHIAEYGRNDVVIADGPGPDL